MPNEIAVVDHNDQSGSLLPLIQTALSNNVDPDKLSKMLDLQERWQQARAQERFAAAIAEFQRQCPQIPKTRKVMNRGEKTGVRYAYASLDDIMRVAGPLLAQNGITLGFDTRHIQDGAKASMQVTLRIRVGAYHEDRSMQSTVPMDTNLGNEPQRFATALSYLKRYLLCAALNIVVQDEDQDAEGLVDTISATQLVELEALIQETKSDLDRILKWQGIDSLDVLPRQKFLTVKDQLIRKKGSK